jgi:hypothetical protein
LEGNQKEYLFWLKKSAENQNIFALVELVYLLKKIEYINNIYFFQQNIDTNKHDLNDST